MQSRKPNALFGEKVIVSKLERMELSSINITNLWSDQSLTSFRNLIHLYVNDCWNLHYLLSISMSKSLMNLQSLFVSECGMMESIFEEASIIVNEESIFPKLKNINLRNMKRLRKIWAEFPLHSFGKLDALIIEECNKLENVFPSYMVGKFRSLCNLNVTNCKSMKEIFDLKGREKPDAEDMTNLQNLLVKNLPNLEHVWNKDPEEILNFKNLKKIWVQECVKLKHIFPVSLAKGLKKLEYLEVQNCGQLEKIVSMGETNNLSSVSFEFPKLTTVRFSNLPNLESFYGDEHKLCCSTLNNLCVELCQKLELFRKVKENPEINPVFLPKEEIYNLKSMQIEPHNADLLKTYIGDYRMYNLEEFQLSRLQDCEILYFFLHRNPNLKSLLMSNCFFEQLVHPRRFAEENLGVVPKLKSLKLMNLRSLKMIGFEEDRVLFQRLEYLILEECPCLDTLAPSSISFTYLTNLEVSNCNKLRYLITPSTAKSLVQLTTMKVIQCESMKTVVLEQENEEQIINELLKKKKASTTNRVLMETKPAIVFRQLKEIELVALHSLERFNSSIHYAFEFPSLEKVVASECGKMKSFTFSEKDEAPILRQICVRYGTEEKIYYCKGDLNATINDLYQTRALDPDHMVASNAYGALESLRLKILKLVNCELESHAIPTAVFPSLKNLEELEVRNTNVEVIFGMQETELKDYPFPLKKLTLVDLPKLIQVWDKDREVMLSFLNLQQVLVTHCERLKTLFPLEQAIRVEKLKTLEIRQCEMFQEIVEEGNAITEATTEFSFPRLTSLNLCMLPQLTCFYPGRFTLECPDLNHLEVLFCDKLKTFQNQQQEPQTSTSVNKQPLFSEGKTNFVLESLKLDWENTRMLLLCNKNFLRDMLHKLVELELDFKDVQEVPSFLVEILVKILVKPSNLECLKISGFSFLELFPSQPEQSDSDTTVHRYSTTLSLVCLHKLCVSSCPRLTTLVHSALSFSNLNQLSIKDCQELKYLFTSSTARTLVHLEEMSIMQCELVEVILAKGLEETTLEVIRFERLNTIILHSLSSLSCFYSGSHTLLLSSLIRVIIWECPNMKIFSQGLIDAKYDLGIQVSLDPNEEYLFFHHDLNTPVKGTFQQQEFFDAILKTRYSSDSWLQADHVGNVSVGIQNQWLRNLGTLNLDKWILPYVIPSVILHLLNNLEAVQVGNNNKVEVIFYMNDTEIMGTPSRLKKLTFQKLSGLRHVWGKNSEGLLSVFPNLEEVVVRECENLQTLFPTSQAKHLKKLRKLEIGSCHKLQEIVQREEDTPTNKTEQFVFPLLEKLDLSGMPQLAYFYPQTFTLECPALQILSVLDCDELELFQTTRFMGESEGEGTSSSNLKVISNLKELRLDWKHILESSLRFRSGDFMEGLKYLNEISLHFGAVKNERPIWLIELLRKTPNLMKMSISRRCNPEIFFAANHKIDEGMLGQLKILELRQVSELQFIKSKDSSWRNTIFENIQDLNVVGCHDLTTLIHSTSTATFSFLKKVSIFNCPNLQCLFTSSAAEKLMNLEEIKVVGCESMKEIMAKESNATSEAIKFKRLNTIVLCDLRSLLCFYSGNHTLKLTSLITVHIEQCFNMKFFSERVIYAESFQGIQTGPTTSGGLLFHKDLNTTVKAIMQRQEIRTCLWTSMCFLAQACFYPGRFTLECPDLNHLEVLFCDKLKTFQNQQEPQTSTSVNKQPLFSEGKTNFVLESLKLDWENARMLLLCNKNFERHAS
ncbi:uncharacterized protein LOC114916014 [Cajanus cajan]|uniref:uncharacterized protein LOC114916014 n=1 Tax=Cajanus cajan TaxID=3821 RepID=UPI0010FB3BB0|nr:uncharacterized protein LOC114916014 [Cajanus cajan]